MVTPDAPIPLPHDQPRAPAVGERSRAGRLFYLDNLRVALTALVIAHHAGQAYGLTGGWWPIMEPRRAVILGAFFTVNRSFFMSLFFMVSDYLLVMAYDRSEPWAFVRSRLWRLGAALAQSQYAAYVFHIGIIVGLNLALSGVALPPLAKFGLVAAVGIPLTFFFSYWARKPFKGVL
jgi:hypothetical protein